MASKLGYRQVIGMGFARELAKVARKNLAKTGFSNAVVVGADVADFGFPDCDIVVYIYNPFSIEVMLKVLANSQKSKPKKLYVI